VRKGGEIYYQRPGRLQLGDIMKAVKSCKSATVRAFMLDSLQSDAARGSTTNPHCLNVALRAAPPQALFNGRRTYAEGTPFLHSEQTTLTCVLRCTMSISCGRSPLRRTVVVHNSSTPYSNIHWEEGERWIWQVRRRLTCKI
jgi:hypothetical protein